MSFSTHAVGIKHELIRVSRRRSGVATVKEVQSELHATKGWRVLSVRYGTTKAYDVPKYQAVWYPKRPKPGRGESIEVPLKAQMRHRERRRDLQRAANLARMETGL